MSSNNFQSAVGSVANSRVGNGSTLCRFAGAMSRCGATNQIQHYPRQPAKHLDLQATERKANQLADLRIDDTHTALPSTVAGRWRLDLIAREEFRPSVLRLLRTRAAC